MSKRRLPLISTSEMRTYHRCPKKHHFAYRLRVRPRIKGRALRFGSLFHVGQETWWQTVNLVLAIDAMREYAQRELQENGVPTDPFDMAKAVALMHGYHER